MVSFNIVRSLFPAFRGYSQALIIDEVQTLIASGACTWSRLFSLIGTELIRRYLEGFIESIAFFVEREQMRQRVTLDVPTQEDPQIRDLLHESELFARSFHGGGFAPGKLWLQIDAKRCAIWPIVMLIGQKFSFAPPIKLSLFRDVLYPTKHSLLRTGAIVVYLPWFPHALSELHSVLVFG
ncbi:hypothetical protein MPER_08238 [Moniliophthora perniciosa FA553]|nr:hypothetical protein MPER_08238 [Moniliophthora perniciosa FA553]